MRPLCLLVDAGNTRIKWAVVDNAAALEALGQWLHTGSTPHGQIEQLAQDWKGREIERVILSNVAGTAIREHLQRILLDLDPARPPRLAWQVSAPELAGVRNGYRQPQQLGSDRFASAIGAHALYPGRALIVVTCGTATTIDAITAEGLFIGGMIMPGLAMMASSLARNTAQLPQAAQQLLAQNGQVPLFADNTEDAIINGCVAAQAGAIERAVANFARNRPDEALQCIVSGGAGALIAAQLAVSHVHVDNLVLLGLQKIACQDPQTLFPNSPLC